MLAARVSVKVRDAAREVAAQERRSLSNMVELLLESALAARKNGKAGK